jgi:hypothetical protein
MTVLLGPMSGQLSCKLQVMRCDNLTDFVREGSEVDFSSATSVKPRNDVWASVETITKVQRSYQ